MLPNFIGIGAQRAATTWAWKCLMEHPQVHMPKKKELHFFNKDEHDLAWYEAQFQEGHAGQPAVGEITPNYLDIPFAAERIAKLIPQAKLFVILREPVDRAFSAYTLFKDGFKGKTFQQAMREHPYLSDLGMYAKHLRRFHEYFPRERVKVFLYEDVKNSPRAFLSELYRYLGVDDKFVPSAMNETYNKVVFKSGQNFIRRLGLGFMIDLVKRTPLGTWIKNLAKAPTGDNTVSPEIRKEFKPLFREDVLDLQGLIGRDLSAWL